MNIRYSDNYKFKVVYKEFNVIVNFKKIHKIIIINMNPYFCESFFLMHFYYSSPIAIQI